MTKEQALYRFFSGFGLNAYEENSVYDLDSVPEFPYITYEVSTDDFYGGDIPISASLWYRSTSWNAANNKVKSISEFIGSGNMIKIDDGYMYLRKGSPFSQSMGDSSDSAIKRKLLNLTVRFYTNN